MKRFVFILLLFVCEIVFSQDVAMIHERYQNYRSRLLDEWLVTSENVEQFGVNIPAMDRRVDSNGKRIWISWSDGNANFNHWLGILSTEYRLLKDNGQNYDETLKLLVYSMLSIERLDLYSEYALRCHHGLASPNTSDVSKLVKYPDDINGFLIRDDVSLGFWKQYHDKFGVEYGSINKSRDGTGRYLSVFQCGVIAKEGMSQDNICYMIQGLAIVKALVDDESLANVPIKFVNPYIPDYLEKKGIFKNGKVYFGLWVDDIVDRLVGHMYHDYPERRLSMKISKTMKARPYENSMGSLLSTRWYVTNPVTNDMVAEGNGEDMGVWINSYGIAEAATKLTGKNYHNDGSNYGLSKYVFVSVLYKDARVLGLGGLPLPDGIDDYMTRALATVGDINRGGKKSTRLLYLLDDKREKWTYEQNTLILYLLHKDKYSRVYHAGTKLYDDDEMFYRKLLAQVPEYCPSTDSTRKDWSPYWSTTSRMNWPKNTGRVDCKNVWEFSGMDFMFLYNLYRLVFNSKGYEINRIQEKNQRQYMTPEMQEPDVQYFLLPPTGSKLN
ncbi:MAG: hypothetical protein IK025_04170 [Bacteroidales bacterium]|nr:hypothetical protein [Bacteroidales bacterium]